MQLLVVDTHGRLASIVYADMYMQSINFICWCHDDHNYDVQLQMMIMMGN